MRRWYEAVEAVGWGSCWRGCLSPGYCCCYYCSSAGGGDAAGNGLTCGDTRVHCNRGCNVRAARCATRCSLLVQLPAAGRVALGTGPYANLVWRGFSWVLLSLFACSADPTPGPGRLGVLCAAVSVCMLC